MLNLKRKDIITKKPFYNFKDAIKHLKEFQIFQKQAYKIIF